MTTLLHEILAALYLSDFEKFLFSGTLIERFLVNLGI